MIQLYQGLEGHQKYVFADGLCCIWSVSDVSGCLVK